MFSRSRLSQSITTLTLVASAFWGTIAHAQNLDYGLIGFPGVTVVPTPSVSVGSVPPVVAFPENEEGYYDEDYSDYYEAEVYGPVDYPLGYETVDAPGSWGYAVGLGLYNYEEAPWIYVMHLGWVYLLDIDTDTSDREQGYQGWLYSPEIGRFWWSEATGKYIYLNATQTWAYIERDRSDSRPWLYNFDSAQWQKPNRPQRHMEDVDLAEVFSASDPSTEGYVSIKNLVEIREGVEYSGDIEAYLSDSGVSGTLYMDFRIAVDPANFNGFLFSIDINGFDSNYGWVSPSDFGASDPGFPEKMEFKLQINDAGTYVDYEYAIYLTNGDSETGSGGVETDMSL